MCQPLKIEHKNANNSLYKFNGKEADICPPEQSEGGKRWGITITPILAGMRRKGLFICALFF